MLKEIPSRVIVLRRHLGFALRRAWIPLAHPGVRLGQGVIVLHGVRFSATDGGDIRIGDNTALSPNAALFAKRARLVIGRSVHIGIGCVIAAREGIEIDDHAQIAEYVTIRDQDHQFAEGGLVAQSGYLTAPVRIGRNVWIGAKATITKGVTIGDNAVIGANSVVTRDIPANAVAVGAPARVVRMREAGEAGPAGEP